MAVAKDAQRLGVPRLRLEDARPRACGLRRIIEPIGVDAPELLENGETSRVVGREGSPALQCLSDRREVLIALGLPLERIENGDRARILFEHPPVKVKSLGAHVE